MHRRRLVEVVLHEILRPLGLGITEESPRRGIHAVVVVALLLHVHNVVPLAVQRRVLVGLDVVYQRDVRCPDAHHRYRRQQQRGKDSVLHIHRFYGF